MSIEFTSSTYGFNWRNRIINGDCRIDQRNFGVQIVPTSGTYTIDRIYFGLSAASQFKVQQNAGSVTPPTGFTNYLGFTTGVGGYSVGTSGWFGCSQLIEGLNVADLGWGAAGAQPITFSFWVYSNLTGLHGGYVRNGSTNYCYVFSYTITTANTWQKVTVTVPGPTSGTWATNTTCGIELGWSLGIGTNYQTTAGAWTSGNYLDVTSGVSTVGTANATWYITGVQLEAGTIATPFERRSYGLELTLAQRYCQIVGNFSGYIMTNLTSAYVTASFIPPMRSAPTLPPFPAAAVGSLYFGNPIGANPVVNAIGSYGIWTALSAQLALTLTGGTGTPASALPAAFIPQMANGGIIFTAEL